MVWPFRKKTKIKVKRKHKKTQDKFKEEFEEHVKRKIKERSMKEKDILKLLPPIKRLEKRAALPKEVYYHDKKILQKKKIVKQEYIKSGIPGFDELLENGIPKSSSILVAGGPGSGKTIFCLQTLYHGALNGEKCLYISFEEAEERLRQHMREFGWNIDEMEEKELIKIFRLDPFKISRAVETLLAQAKGKLYIKFDEEIFNLPKEFKPNRIVLDSLSALGAAFTGRESGYRIYIEELFRHFEKMGVTSFLISETEQVPTIFSRTGIEEFLADGVFVLYNLKEGNVRIRAIEILKLRGTRHEEKIVPFEITKEGIIVHPSEPIIT